MTPRMWEFMNVMSKWGVLALVMCVGLVAGCSQEKPGEVLRIGYMNCNSEAETRARFAPLTRYLEQQLGVRLEAVPVDTQDFEERYARGEFDITHTNSLLYLVLHEDHQLQLVATEKRGNFGPRTAGAIIVRRDSDIETLADLKGKRMIFGPQLAPSGFLAQYSLLLENGVNPEKDLAYYAFPSGSFKHEKVIYGVYFGAYDVAAAPALDLEIMTREGKIAADDFRVLAQSRIFPYCTFGVHPRVDAKLRDKLRQALAGLNSRQTVEIDGESVGVLKSAWIDGFEVLADSDYDILRDMARRANMPPYQEF